MIVIRFRIIIENIINIDAIHFFMTDDLNTIRNIWELYGVKSNPFDTNPLLLRGGTIPIESFVGREEDIKRLNRIIGSKGGSRTLVYGDIGVGKTTFVNVVRNNAMKNNFFTPIREIAVQQDWEPINFILNTLSAIYTTLELTTEKPISKENFKRLECLFKIGKTNVNLGIEVAGIGGNYGKENSPPLQITNSALQDFFIEIVDDIIENTNREIIIHYNNLELLHENKIHLLFNNLRDFFQTNGVHFIFVGNLTVKSIFQSIPRFSSILTDTPFNIENLSYSETEEIIEKRFKTLKIDNMNYFIPYTKDSLQSLYKLMNGNIRFILNSLSTAVLAQTINKPIQFNAHELSKILKSVLEERYFNKLKQRQKDVLFEIVSHDEITNKGLSDNLKIKRSNISTYISDLVNEGCVYLRRKNGKDKFWSADPKIRWYLLEEKKPKIPSLFSYGK